MSGYNFLYLFRKQELKQAMKEYLLNHPDPGNVTEFRFSLNDKRSLTQLEWENNHEFWYKNDMYDLVDKKTENDQLIIRCISDKSESNLVKLQEKISKENQGDASSKSRSALLLRLIQSAFIAVDVPTIHDFSSTPHFFLHKDSYTFSADQDVLTPPPQQI